MSALRPARSAADSGRRSHSRTPATNASADAATDTPGRKPRYGEEAVGYLTRIIRQRIDSPWRPIPRQEEGRVQN
jgi:hypothetical protein